MFLNSFLQKTRKKNKYRDAFKQKTGKPENQKAENIVGYSNFVILYKFLKEVKIIEGFSAEQFRQQFRTGRCGRS